MMATTFSNLTWQEQTWRVMNTNGGTRSPGPNVYDPRNVTVDPATGNLKLAIVQRDGRWTCSELRLEQGFGYGRYRWRVKTPLAKLDPTSVFGLFTYDWINWDRPGAGEVDIEFTRWRWAADPTNCEFSVQPTTSARNKRITVSANASYECWFTWKTDSITFSVRDASGVLKSYRTTSGVTPPTKTTWPFIDLWLDKGQAPANGKPVYIELENFRFEKV